MVSNETVAERIKKKREELGMSQAELARRLGLSDRSSVSKIEKSGNDITLKNIERIAAILNVSESYLMGWESTADHLMLTGNSSDDIEDALFIESPRERSSNSVIERWHTVLSREVLMKELISIAEGCTSRQLYLIIEIIKLFKEPDQNGN